MGSTFRRRRLLSFLLLALSASGCGGSESSSSRPGHTTPTAPTPSPTPTPTATPNPNFVNIAGTWAGTIETANQGRQSISMLVVQFDNCVDGSWKSTSGDWSGAISGFAGRDSYTGQISLERPASSPDGACQAIGNITGEVGSNTLRWTGSGFTATRPCAGELPQDIVITMRRQ